MTQANNAGQLLDITLRTLRTDPAQLLPMANSFIDQWVRALGATDRVLDDIAVELEQLKAALTHNRPLQIAESLHSLAKLCRKAGEEAEEETAGKLRQLAEQLDALSAGLGRK